MGPALEVARVPWPAGAVGGAEWPSQTTKPYISCPPQGGGFMQRDPSRESGPEIGSRFTDSRWGGRGEREHTLFPKTKHARPSQRPSKLLECCRHAAGVLLWPSARRDEVLIEAVGLNAPTHPCKTQLMTGPDCCSNNVLISTFSSERSQRGLVPALPA